MAPVSLSWLPWWDPCPTHTLPLKEAVLTHMPSQDMRSISRLKCSPETSDMLPPLPATNTQTHIYTHTSRRETYQFYHIFQKSALKLKFKKETKASFWELVKRWKEPSPLKKL